MSSFGSIKKWLTNLGEFAMTKNLNDALKKLKPVERSVLDVLKEKQKVVDKEDFVYLDGNIRTGEDPVVACTCGWHYGPASNLYVLGTKGKEHSEETGHKMRQHKPND